MDIKYELTGLKTMIVKEPAFNNQATVKAKNMIDEMIKVLNKSYDKVVSKAPTNITRQFSSSFGSKSIAYGSSSGKKSVYNKIDSIKTSLVMDRFIDNSTKEWIVKKLNMLTRL